MKYSIYDAKKYFVDDQRNLCYPCGTRMTPLEAAERLNRLNEEIDQLKKDLAEIMDTLDDVQSDLNFHRSV